MNTLFIIAVPLGAVVTTLVLAVLLGLSERKNHALRRRIDTACKAGFGQPWMNAAATTSETHANYKTIFANLAKK